MLDTLDKKGHGFALSKYHAYHAYLAHQVFLLLLYEPQLGRQFNNLSESMTESEKREALATGSNRTIATLRIYAAL